MKYVQPTRGRIRRDELMKRKAIGTLLCIMLLSVSYMAVNAREETVSNNGKRALELSVGLEWAAEKGSAEEEKAAETVEILYVEIQPAREAQNAVTVAGNRIAGNTPQGNQTNGSNLPNTAQENDGSLTDNNGNSPNDSHESDDNRTDNSSNPSDAAQENDDGSAGNDGSLPGDSTGNGGNLPGNSTGNDGNLPGDSTGNDNNVPDNSSPEEGNESEQEKPSVGSEVSGGDL